MTIASRSRRISSISARARMVMRTAPGLERGANAGAADDDAAGGKIRARHDAHQLVERRVRIGDQRQRRIDDLAGIVRRDVGRHADGDAVAAVDQQVGKPRRKDLRFLLGLVVVGLEIDGVLVDVVQQQRGRARQPHLGVAHRRRRIAVDRAEIALPVDQRHPHRERLRHAHHGVVDRRVAVRVVLAHHVADHAGRLAVRPVGGVAGVLHAEQDAPVHRLQPVAGVRQRARHDHAHGVVEVGAAHLLLEGHRLGVFGRTRRRVVGGIAQKRLDSVVRHGAPEGPALHRIMSH